MTAIALDIGGSKIAAAIVGRDGAPGDVVTVPTPEVGVWPAVAGLLHSIAGGSIAGGSIARAGVTRVGISSPGPVD